MSKHRNRRPLGGLAAIVLVAAAVVLALWLHEPEPTLERGWDAVVVTIAGGAVPGAAQNPYALALSDPFGIAVSPDGTVYVADGAGADLIYRIEPDGTPVVFAGSAEGFADGAAESARFSTPSGLALDARGNLYVADTGNDAIRRVAPDGTVSTIAGAAAGLNGPVGVAVHPDGRVIVADTYNDRILAIDTDGKITSVAGSGRRGFEDGAAASFDTPCGVAVDANGAIYVADTGNGAVRIIAPDGVVSTMPAYVDRSFSPVALTTGGGSVFVADAGGRIIEMTAAGEQRTLAGIQRGFADGPGADARFRAPSGIALAAPGHLLVTDRRNGLVRLVAARSLMSVRPPAPPLHPHFDVETFNRAPLLWPFAPLEGPFEITGTLGEPRGVAGSERFHAGLDVHAAEGTPVRTIRAGISDDPLAARDFASLSESVRIGPITYIHLRVARALHNRVIEDGRFVVTRDERGDPIGVRLKRGSRFALGDVIGTVNRFYHAHLNIGWPGEEVNPLHARLAGFEDTVPPVIARGGVRLVGAGGLPLKPRERKRIVVEGPVRIVVDAWDQVNGNLARRRLGLYRLGYDILDADGNPVPGFEGMRETIRFDRHPAGRDAARIIYAQGSGIPVYGSRTTRFLYVVTSTLRDGVAADGMFDATRLAPGDYTIRILAADVAGNEAIANRDLAITIPGARNKP